MDFNKFGKVFLILGIIIICFGENRFIGNFPKKFDDMITENQGLKGWGN